eukprot:6185101-Pleurochrysis_carterae.AAC.2
MAASRMRSRRSWRSNISIRISISIIISIAIGSSTRYVGHSGRSVGGFADRTNRVAAASSRGNGANTGAST